MKISYRCPCCGCSEKERLEQIRNNLVCFMDNMEIGIGRATIKVLIKSGWVQDCADLYEETLKEGLSEILEGAVWRRDLADLYESALAKGWSWSYLYKRRSLEVSNQQSMRHLYKKAVLKSIEASKQQPLNRLLAALNIRQMGSRVAHLLACHCGTMEMIQNASDRDLMCIPRIGQTGAKKLWEFFNEKVNSELIEKLKNSGLNMTEPGGVDMERVKLSRKLSRELNPSHYA